jgi:hypothetical protein
MNNHRGDNMHRLRVALPTLVVAVLMLVGLGATPAHASSQRIIGHNAFFINRNSNKCLEIGYSRVDDFAPANQYFCHYLDNQLWDYDTGTGLIMNVHSGKCLEDLNYSTANGAPVGQYRCYGGLNQQWWMSPETGLIENAFSHKCLEVINYSHSDFGIVGQWDCYGGSNQIWMWPAGQVIQPD